MAGHEDGVVMTSHIGTNTPKFVPPRWGRPPFDLFKRGCANSVVGLELGPKVFPPQRNSLKQGI